MDCPVWTRWMASYGEAGADEREQDIVDDVTMQIFDRLSLDEEEQSFRERLRQDLRALGYRTRLSLDEQEEARRAVIREEEARRSVIRSRQGEMPEEQASAAPKFKCHQCDLEYSSQAELADHQASEIGRGERTGKYPCAKCYRSFDNEYQASFHQAQHERSWDYGWAAHRTKTTPRFISCPVRFCHMGFKTEAELQAHLRRVHETWFLDN